MIFAAKRPTAIMRVPLALLALVLGPVSCGGSETPPSPVGRVAFVSEGGIVVMNRNGTARRLAAEGAAEPEWSPDGRSIAYLTSGGIHVVTTDGSDRRLTRTRTSMYQSDWGVAWSPDGSRIAFNRSEDVFHSIYVVEISSRKLRRLTSHGNFSPSWSPDGRHIAYVHTARRGDGIWVMKPDGTAKRRIAPAEFPSHGVPGPAWSPDGHWIAFASDVDLWVMRSDGASRARKLLGDADRGLEDLSWSPNSRKLAVAHGDGDWEIFVVNVDGSELVNLTDNRGVQDEDPTWSPGGEQIAFERLNEETYEVWVMNPDGEGQGRLTESGGYDPAWSPTRRP